MIYDIDDSSCLAVLKIVTDMVRLGPIMSACAYITCVALVVSCEISHILRDEIIELSSKIPENIFLYILFIDHLLYCSGT